MKAMLKNLVVVAAVAALPAVAFAQDGSGAMRGSGKAEMKAGAAFVDADGDGICDNNATKARGAGQGKAYGKGGSKGKGAHAGPADGTGLQKGKANGKASGNGTGICDGTGKGRSK